VLTWGAASRGDRVLRRRAPGAWCRGGTAASCAGRVRLPHRPGGAPYRVWHLTPTGPLGRVACGRRHRAGFRARRTRAPYGDRRIVRAVPGHRSCGPCRRGVVGRTGADRAGRSGMPDRGARSRSRRAPGTEHPVAGAGTARPERRNGGRRCEAAGSGTARRRPGGGRW